MAFFTRAGAQVKPLRIGKQIAASRLAGSASAGIDHRLRSPPGQQGSDRSGDGVSGQRPDGVASTTSWPAPIAFHGDIDRDAMRFPPCRPARGRSLAEAAEGTPRATHDVAEGGATRSGAHRCRGRVCAAHAATLTLG